MNLFRFTFKNIDSDDSLLRPFGIFTYLDCNRFKTTINTPMSKYRFIPNKLTDKIFLFNCTGN